MEKNFKRGSYQQVLYTAFEFDGNPYLIQEVVNERNQERSLMREGRTL